MKMKISTTTGSCVIVVQHRCVCYAFNAQTGAQMVTTGIEMGIDTKTMVVVKLNFEV